MNFSELFSSSKAVRCAVVTVLVILALFLAAETVTLVQNFGRSTTAATNTVTVSASGQATLPPDIAKISFTVENTAKTVADAQAATTKQANAALAFVKGQGVADKDVRTASYNISPQYTYTTCTAGSVCPPSNRTLTGYQVSESVQVKLRDLTKVGAFLAGLGKLSVQNVSGPDFTLDDTSAGYDAARADAIAKAKAQAALLAEQLDVHLGKIVSFTQSSSSPGPIMYRTAGIGGAVESSATSQVPVGENTYTASVSITYEI